MTFTENNSVRIHYEVAGEGPTLVLQTGAGGDLQMWRLAGYVLGLAGFRVVLIDPRGRGQSSRPAGLDEHRMKCFVSDVLDVVEDVGAGSVGFWGYSSGALVGVAFGAAHPTRLRALVVTGSLPFIDATEQPPLASVEEETRRLVASGGVVRELEEFMARTGERFPADIDRNVRDTDPTMYALDEIAWRSWHGPRSAYPNFRAPVLAIAGELEDLKRHTERSTAAMPAGRTVRLPGVGHLGAFSRSDLALPLALPFLRHAMGIG